jgi:hypothetical protein
MIFANVNEAIHFLFGYLGRRKLRLARERQSQIVEEGHSATHDQSANSLSSGYELQNLRDRGNAEMETAVVSSLQSRDQPVGTLR